MKTKIQMGASELVELGRSSRRLLPTPRPGTLKGWKASDSAPKRHAALKRAVKAESCRSVINRLTLERNFTHRTSPKTAAAAKKDWKWLKKQGFCHLKNKK